MRYAIISYGAAIHSNIRIKKHLRESGMLDNSQAKQKESLTLALFLFDYNFPPTPLNLSTKAAIFW